MKTHKIEMSGRKLLRVFVWEFPVRLFHWINALAVLVLIISGYLIGNPPALISSEEASYRYLFGTIRYIHFVSAYIFAFNWMFRIYWAFVGNKYANWRNFIPTNRRYIKELISVLKIDVLLAKSKEHMSVGHNAMAGFTYFLLFLASLLIIVTGFGLYAPMSDWWFPELFTWVAPAFGGDFALRNIHHSLMWFFVFFSLIHIYLVFYHDYVEGRGEISSMGGGWKFIEEKEFIKDEERHEQERKNSKKAQTSNVEEPQQT